MKKKRFFDSHEEFCAEVDRAIDNRWADATWRIRRYPLLASIWITRKAVNQGRDFGMWYSCSLLKKSITSTKSKEVKEALQDMLDAIQKKQHDLRCANN